MAKRILNGTGANTLMDYANDKTLGYVVWHSVCDVRITESEVEKLAIKHGLSKFPKLGSDSDAFRRATSQVQSRDKDSKTRYLMRPVNNSGGEIIREIVVERVDAKGKRLAHIGAVTITYDSVTDPSNPQIHTKETSQWATVLRDIERERVCEMIKDTLANYAAFSRNLTGAQLTRFAMSCLNELSYINLRPHGGVYFVTTKHARELHNLSNFFVDLEQYRNSSAPMIFSCAPVPADDMQRKQVLQSAEHSINTEIDQLVATIVEKADDAEGMRESTVTNLVEAAATIRIKSQNYAKILEDSKDLLGARLHILDAAIQNLMNNHANAQAKKSKPVRKSA